MQQVVFIQRQSRVVLLLFPMWSVLPVHARAVPLEPAEAGGAGQQALGGSPGLAADPGVSAGRERSWDWAGAGAAAVHQEGWEKSVVELDVCRVNKAWKASR